MKNKNSHSNDHQAFAAMDADQRIEAAAEDTSRSKEELKNTKVPEPACARGFAAMDENTRKQIARRGGSVSRRNRIKNQEQVVIL